MYLLLLGFKYDLSHTVYMIFIATFAIEIF